MSRHTLEDGVTPDERIRENESCDEWLRVLAPPGKLVGSYYRSELSWDEYEVLYREHLHSEEVYPILAELAKRCTNEVITLLCIEDTPEQCHRRVLAEELQMLEPSLNIIHK